MAELSMRGIECEEILAREKLRLANEQDEMLEKLDQLEAENLRAKEIEKKTADDLKARVRKLNRVIDQLNEENLMFSSQVESLENENEMLRNKVRIKVKHL